MLHRSVGRESGPAVRVAHEADGEAALDRLAAVILLCGSVRSQPWVRSLGVSLLALPLDADRLLIDQWCEQTQRLRRLLGRSSLPVRVMVDRTALMPPPPSGDSEGAFSVERDPLDYRGTGGVLHDVAAQYEPDQCLLVANGAQLLLEPLSEMARRLAAASADLSIVAHRDGTPSGLMLARCGLLASIAERGFIDMKEQVLPQIAQEHHVGLVHRDQPSGLPIRTLSDYLASLRTHHTRLAHHEAATVDPFAEDLRSAFSIVQRGASVDPTAHVHDSVVLGGARVEAGAILVRSLVCRGAVVRRNQRVVGRVIRSGAAPGRRHRDQEAEA